ncbi:TetR/AcrR family transcriptional regulator [Sneathiella aquimaris]|uniref:TetR/AcrR family transcriptional regulator n=1 Tax=Sneathiella aquimaris TaxID=2599305 RepID=UPI00146C4357|nr:TetR/AcrR family transcriptional regulator [Sneathiella aquimaris]
MSKGLQTKARIVDVAADLIQTSGYHAMGINQITAHGKIPKGSLYFHFPGGKEAIALAAIEQGGQTVQSILCEARQGADTTEAFISAVVEAFCALLTNTGFQKGCPVSSITLEMAPGSDPITAACKDVFDRWHHEIEEALVQLKCSHPNKPALATLLLSAIEGSLIICRAQKNTRSLEETKDLLLPLCATN